MTLIRIISLSEDTVLLKRAGSLERYEYFKQKVSSIEQYDKNQINQITNECIKENISFGGSSDLLAVLIFIIKMKKSFYRNVDLLGCLIRESVGLQYYQS